MADHLPECAYSQPCPDEWRNARTIKTEGLPVPHRIVSGSSGRCVECGAGDCICYELREFGNACAAASYAAGLAAAREAVAALSHGAEKSAWDEYTIGAADGIRDALAAIDALREKEISHD